MIGRVVHYRDRRILIFCGERSHDQHPVYGAVDNGAVIGAEAEARTYQSNKFHEAESAVALGASNEAKITSAARLPVVESCLSARQTVKATAYVSVNASVSNGVFVENDVDPFETSSVFAEAESGTAASERVEAIKTLTARLTEAEEAVATGESDTGFVTAHSNRAEAGDGMSTLQSAEAYVEQSVFAEAESGTAASERVEAIKTLTARLTEAEEAVATGESDTGFVTAHSNRAEAGDGMSTLQSAEAYVEQPVQNVIRAGKYATNAYVLPFEEATIYAPIYYHSSITEDDIYASGIYLDYSYYQGDIVWVLYGINPTSAVALGTNQDIFDTGNIDDYWHIFTDDGTFTVTADTEVTAEQYEIFNRYFQLVPAPQTVITAGVYGGNSGVSTVEACEISLPLSYMLGYDQLTASSIEIEAGQSIMAWRDKLQEDGDYIGAVDENGQVLLITGDDPALFNGTITVTADTQVTETEYRQFHKYFVLVNGN